MGTALAIAGWLAFAAAAAAAALVRNALSARAEAVARACHEVRGSLTAARVGLEWGLDSQPSPRSRLRAIELELDRAAAALDDLQEVDSGRLLESELVDVEGWLSDSVEAWRPLAVACGIELTLRWQGPQGTVRGRRARLAQASDNLIANAIEHGGPPIEVLGRVDDGRVRIEVVDGGPGLPGPELRQRKRSRWARRPQNPRRGRGLAIAQDVALGHGGTLEVAPSEQGARLVLELPLAGAVDASALRR